MTPIKNHISQEKWFLDSVAICTEAIGIDGHQILIPVYKRLFINQVYIPPMMQRIYLPEGIDKHKMAGNLVQLLISRFSAGVISISEELNIAGISKTKKTNYILSLDRNHEQICSDYRKGHKLNLKTFHQNQLQITESADIEESVKFYEKFSNPEIPLFYKNAKLLNKCFTSCFRHHCGFLIQARDSGDQLIAIAFFSLYHNRLTYHLSCSSPIGKKYSAMYGIIDYMIRKYQNSEITLDFEGSSIPGLALFMSGFGAVEENYFSYRWNRNPFLRAIQWMRNKS